MKIIVILICLITGFVSCSLLPEEEFLLGAYYPGHGRCGESIAFVNDTMYVHRVTGAGYVDSGRYRKEGNSVSIYDIKRVCDWHTGAVNSDGNVGVRTYTYHSGTLRSGLEEKDFVHVSKRFE